MGLRRHGHNLNYATVIDVLQVLIMGSIFVVMLYTMLITIV